MIAGRTYEATVCRAAAAGTALLVLLLAGCIDFEKSGRDLGSGLTNGVKENADTVGARLGGGLVQGARDSLTSAETERRLQLLVDRMGEALARQVTASRDSLMGEYSRLWIAQLKDELLGKKTQDQVGALRDEVIGPKTTAFLRDSMATVAAMLRDELLGARTQAAVDSIVKSAIATLSQEYRDKMQPIVHEEESFIQRNASTLLWTAGGVIAVVLVIAGVIFMKRMSDRKLLGLLTFQIHGIPEKKAYDELVGRIRDRAQEEGLEPRLRQVLREHGILSDRANEP